MAEPWFPLSASPSALLGTFIGALIIFDIVLVRWLKIGRRAWKRVDYIWLAVAVAGLWGTASEVRRFVASETLGFQRELQAAAYDMLRTEVGFLSSSATCSSFQRTEFSPPNLDDIQREYQSVCQYGQSLLAALPRDAPEQIDRVWLSRRPTVGDSQLRTMYGDLDQALGRYRTAESRTAGVVRASDRSDVERTFVILSPLLLAVALALRITKVTGELRLEA